MMKINIINNKRIIGTTKLGKKINNIIKKLKKNFKKNI